MDQADTIWIGAVAYDPKVVTIWEGMRRYLRDEANLPFDTDLGKHGDTGTSEIHVLRAVLEGKADAGAIGSPAWSGVQEQALVPAGSLTEVWTSPPYSHCMFTARPGLDEDIGRRFAEAL